MDFLFSLSLAKYEVYFLVVNSLLLVFYFGTWILEKSILLFTIVFGKKNETSPEEKIEAPKESPSKRTHKTEESKTETEEVPSVVTEEAPHGLTPDDKQNLLELTKVVKTKIARGEFSEAKSKIIEGLTVDKFDKELNCLLASLYERDKDYRRAELVYKDLVIVHETDPELYTKLGFALSMQ